MGLGFLCVCGGGGEFVCLFAEMFHPERNLGFLPFSKGIAHGEMPPDEHAWTQQSWFLAIC